MGNSKTRESLTNEYLTKYFSDNFSLALSSIHAAQVLVDSGREFRLASLLDSVAKHKAREEREVIKTEVEEPKSQDHTDSEE